MSCGIAGKSSWVSNTGQMPESIGWSVPAGSADIAGTVLPPKAYIAAVLPQPVARLRVQRARLALLRVVAPRLLQVDLPFEE